MGSPTVYRTLQAMASAHELDAIRTEDGDAAYRRCSRYDIELLGTCSHC